MRARSLLNAGNDTSLAIVQYESAIRRFMEATIETVRQVRPGCEVGWLNYPRSSYPHPDTQQWDQYCSAHPDVCWSFSKPGDGPGTGYLGPGAAAQRAFNDKLYWLWDALDVITGVVYMTVGGETTVADTAAYVHSHVAEAVRLHRASQARGGRSKRVVSVTWLLYDDVADHQSSPQFLSASDANVVLSQPLSAGADGVLLWGHLNSSQGASGNNTVAGYNTYLRETAAPIVARVCGNWTCCSQLLSENSSTQLPTTGAGRVTRFKTTDESSAETQCPWACNASLPSFLWQARIVNVSGGPEPSQPTRCYLAGLFDTTVKPQSLVTTPGRLGAWSETGNFSTVHSAFWKAKSSAGAISGHVALPVTLRLVGDQGLSTPNASAGFVRLLSTLSCTFVCPLLRGCEKSLVHRQVWTMELKILPCCGEPATTLVAELYSSDSRCKSQSRF